MLFFARKLTKFFIVLLFLLDVVVVRSRDQLSGPQRKASLLNNRRGTRRRGRRGKRWRTWRRVCFGPLLPSLHAELNTPSPSLPSPRRKVARGLFLPPRLFGGLSLSPPPLGMIRLGFLPLLPPQASPNRGKEEGERAGGRGGYFACCPRRDKNFPFLLLLPSSFSPPFPFAKVSVSCCSGRVRRTTKLLAQIKTDSLSCRKNCTAERQRGRTIFSRGTAERTFGRKVGPNE